ncbi:NLP effector protein 8-like [Penaeus japonicus]|uniref:NLP effector protein 8-like n=1 Tax=Penaeus japonicus TaxID=27405 RepID=UPI001C71773D|nr:NLP effector protein 8-like [Penaeus japonicus]XP_042885560.1 NLP effector protein 8-like [Penaeus japonicus]
MSSHGLHRRWLVVLTVIGLGWIIATTVTVVGMFMTACQREVKTKTDDQGLCQASSLHEGYAMVAVGSLMNVALLVTMLVLLMRDRRQSRVKPDPPPDYESLLKDETPPPSYFELSLDDSQLLQDFVAVGSPTLPTPTATPTPTPALTATLTATPTLTPTATPTATLTATPTAPNESSVPPRAAVSPPTAAASMGVSFSTKVFRGASSEGGEGALQCDLAMLL